MAVAPRSASSPITQPSWIQWIQWARRNLFKTPVDALITVLALGVTVLVIQSALTWILHEETRWEVLAANLNLFLRGRFPAEAAWRIWLVLSLLALAAGMSFGTWGRKVSAVLGIVTAIPLVLTLIPSISPAARLALLLLSALVAGGFVLGRYGPSAFMSQISLTFIVLVLPISIIILRGFGQTGSFAVVSTRLWGGLLLSVILAASGIVFSYPLGILLALGRRSRLPILRILCVLYIEFIRGVPLISLLFMSVTMLQLFLPANFPQIDSIIRVAVAITLFSAAYVAENVRGGLQSLPKGQYEATWALGLNQVQSMIFIILPQALKAIIPITVSQFISLFKDTSLVALVGLFDLLGIGKTVLSNPSWLGTHREVYFFIGAVFWVLNYSLSYGSRKLEQKLDTGRDRT